MNDGKICISICGKRGDEVSEQIRRAEPLADVIEVRFDCLNREDIETVAAGLSGSRPFLLTYRPESQGGHIPDAMAQRAFFWMTAFSHCDLGADRMWADNEADLADIMQWPESYRIIRSFHNFTGTVENLSDICEKLFADGGIAKLAVHSNSITEAIPLWFLLKKAKREGKFIIPIAMGEAGKWTRILGLAHGAFMTYASLESGSETAPGQISADDMIDVFRVKELNESTEVYGIIAGDTSYSVSPWMHNAAFKAAGMNRVFVPLQVADLGDFMRRMVKPGTREIDLNFRGFSVTNPHKQAILPHLDERDETAAKIGAVNTVKIENGKLHGYNTDAPGFIAPLKRAFSDLKSARVAIAGAGGAARACIYALQCEGADVTLFARDAKKAKPLVNEFGIDFEQFQFSNFRYQIPNFKFSGFDILVNATPLGTKGEKQNETVATADQLQGVKLVYDLTYNPLETRLIREARAAGVPAIGGLEMLIAQGAKQFEIWTGGPAPVEAMAAAVKKKLNL